MWFRFRLQTVCCSMSMKMSMSVENFLGFTTCGSKGCPFFFLVVTKKRETRRALHNGRSVYPFTPPNQKVLVSPLRGCLYGSQAGPLSEIARCARSRNAIISLIKITIRLYGQAGRPLLARSRLSGWIYFRYIKHSQAG